MNKYSIGGAIEIHMLKEPPKFSSVREVVSNADEFEMNTKSQLDL